MLRKACVDGVLARDPWIQTYSEHALECFFICRFVMTVQGTIWRDKNLEEWPENDFRIFVGDLGQHVTDADLTQVG